jgi:hypothetical protein
MEKVIEKLRTSGIFSPGLIHDNLSVPITTNVVSANLDQARCTRYNIM